MRLIILTMQEKCKMESNECIKFSPCTSRSVLTSEYKAKKRERSQPVRITQLFDSETNHRTVRKRAQPVKLKKFSLIENKAVLTQSNNVGDKSQQRRLMKKHLHNENTRSYSKSDRKHTTSHSNECDRKVRRNLNFNVVSPKQRIEEYTGVTCSSVREEKKSICSNLSISRNRKSFLLPPNYIKKMYLKQCYSETKPFSTVSSDNDDTIRHLCQSQTSDNLNSHKLIQCNCKSTRNALHDSIDNEMGTHVKESTTLIDNKMQEKKHYSTYKGNSSMSTNADNLRDISHKLKDIIHTLKSEMSARGNNADFSGEDRLSIDKDTIVSLKYYLEDFLNISLVNAWKVDSLLTHVKKILNASTNSTEEHVNSINSNDETIKKSLKTNPEQNTEENEMNTSIIISVEGNNNVGKKIEVKLNEEEKENETPHKLELKLDHIDGVRSLEFTPKILQITVPNYAKCGESALQDYINLKSHINFLETPYIKRFRSYTPKNKNVLSNIPKDKSYLSTKILTELQNLYE